MSVILSAAEGASPEGTEGSALAVILRSGFGDDRVASPEGKDLFLVLDFSNPRSFGQNPPSG